MNIKPLILLGVALAALFALTAAAHERGDIHASAEDVQPLLPGMTVPAFALKAATGVTVAFEPGEAPRPLVLTFYRGGWCPYCNLHLSELRHADAELREMGFDVWFVSMDLPEVLRPSLEEDVGYTLLSDSTGKLTRAFGIAFRLDDGTFDRYKEFGIDLEEVSGETHHILPAPSTYIIDTDGVIRFQYTNTDYKVRLDPEVLLTAARVFMEDTDGRLTRARESAKQ